MMTEREFRLRILKYLLVAFVVLVGLVAAAEIAKADPALGYYEYTDVDGALSFVEEGDRIPQRYRANAELKTFEELAEKIDKRFTKIGEPAVAPYKVYRWQTPIEEAAPAVPAPAVIINLGDKMRPRKERNPRADIRRGRTHRQ